MLTPAPTTNPEAPEPYWQVRGCPHGHQAATSHRRVRLLMRNHRTMTVEKRKRTRHYVLCVKTRAKSWQVRRHVRRLWGWRRSYPHAWPIRFNRLASWEQGWAYRTGACESGNNPATNTGNGFYGAFQFLLQTWHAAGGTGNPAQHSWAYQAVKAVSWMHKAGDEQWPVCGD